MQTHVGQQPEHRDKKMLHAAEAFVLAEGDDGDEASQPVEHERAEVAHQGDDQQAVGQLPGQSLENRRKLGYQTLCFWASVSAVSIASGTPGPQR